MHRSMRISPLFSLCILISVQVCMAREDVWTEARSPHFTVISDASPMQARKTAKSFEQFRVLLEDFLPPDHKMDAGSPLIVFAMKDGDGLKALLPKDRLKKNAAETAGIFMGNSEMRFVALRLDVPGDWVNHTVYHEYVHMVMRLNYRKLPLWLDEGLAELLAFAKLSDRKSSLGDESPELLRHLRSQSRIPLPVLMTVTDQSPYYTQADTKQAFYARSWALTHYLMLDEKGAHASQFKQFLRLLKDGIAEPEARASAFGDLKILDEDFGKYLEQNRRRLRVDEPAMGHYEVVTELKVKEEEFTVRTLTQAESLALRGQCLIAANRPDEAKAMLEQPLQLDTHSVDANEGMGLVFLRLGNQEQAQKYFLVAAQADSKNFLAQFYAGKAEYEQGGNYQTAETYLRKALEINPNYVPTYSMLAKILLTQNTRLPEALEMGIKAASLEPAELRHRLNVCQILIALGKYEEASREAEEIAKVAESEQDRNTVQSLLSKIKSSQDRIIESQKREEEVRQQAKEIEERRNKNELKTPIERGPAGRMTGVVKSVQCENPATMDIVVESGGKQYRFRAENYFEVQYESVGRPVKPGFKPCEDLEGETVQLTFQSVAGQEFSGFIQKCGIVR
jgi:tetratricopeptide (TPR) repeat protein